ncbi:hypothetical protein [Kitasatospora sp. MAP5-34]|uniref:hypothetical protein n=1 Tax=Kitasatospora sp. MAP5-34 TaxID=3035102 RepID=UPI0024758C34|nr:hypothetical protein [Kitasatospora sp. MAP5-34]MDH6580481.1 hypothetical protein [Kitasatospora sp. MAP5-34]
MCRVLTGAGFDIAAPGAAGLDVRLRHEGVVVGWRLGEVAGPTVATQTRAEAGGTPVEHRGLRDAVTSALSAILEQAGYPVTDHGGDLLITSGALRL